MSRFMIVAVTGGTGGPDISRQWIGLVMNRLDERLEQEVQKIHARYFRSGQVRRDVSDRIPVPIGEAIHQLELHGRKLAALYFMEHWKDHPTTGYIWFQEHECLDLDFSTPLT